MYCCAGGYGHDVALAYAALEFLHVHENLRNQESVEEGTSTGTDTSDERMMKVNLGGISGFRAHGTMTSKRAAAPILQPLAIWSYAAQTSLPTPSIQFPSLLILPSHSFSLVLIPPTCSRSSTLGWTQLILATSPT